MTGRVHVLSKPPEHPRHQRCMDLLGNDDTLVLTGAGLRLLEKPSPLEGIQAGSVMALVEETPDPLTTPESVEVLDHVTFVDRVLAEHQPVFW